MKTKAEISAFLLLKMKEKKVTKVQLGEALGASGATQLKVQKANQFLNPNTPKINLSDLVIAANLLDISPHQILGKDSAESHSDSFLETINIEKRHLVPLLSQAEKSSDEVIDVPEWLVFPFVKNAQKYLALRVDDDSMEPVISEGAIVFLDTKIYNYDLEDKIVLAQYKDQKFIRCFNRKDEVGIILSAKNSDSKIFSTDDDLEIIGVVTHCMSPIANV